MTRGGACPAWGRGPRPSIGTGGLGWLCRFPSPPQPRPPCTFRRASPVPVPASGDVEESRGWARAASGGAVELLGRNIPSILRMTKGTNPNISRRLYIKLQEEGQHQPKSQSALRGPGYKPTDWDKRFLLRAGHFKKPEDIPETISTDTIRAAKTTLRVKFSYVMIALTIVGCITLVIRGKQAIKRHETLTSINLEKKAQWREEATQSTSAKL